MLIIPGIIASSYPVATNSYESIATVTVGSGGSSSISFTSIPSTYKHLQIRAMVNTNRATYGQDDVWFQVNSDTAANYSQHRLQGNGSSASAGGSANTSSIVLYGTAGTTVSNMFGVIVLDILDYADTNKYKTFRALGGVDTNGLVAGYGGWMNLESGLWRSTSALTSISFSPTQNGATAFAQYSHFALYGVKG